MAENNELKSLFGYPVHDDVARAAAAENKKKVDALTEEKMNLPQENGAPNHGTAGQFAVSDGKGGIVWKTLVEAEAVMY